MATLQIVLLVILTIALVLYILHKLGVEVLDIIVMILFFWADG